MPRFALLLSSLFLGLCLLSATVAGFGREEGPAQNWGSAGQAAPRPLTARLLPPIARPAPVPPRNWATPH